MTKEFKGKFTFNSPINSETSYGSTPLADDAASEMEVVINSDGKGWFDWYIEELDEYEEGGLWFDENELTDYDGVFSLPEQLITFLEEQGYNMEYAK
jgi:hypothetical protein